MIGFTRNKQFFLAALGCWIAALSIGSAHAVAPDAPTGPTAVAGNGSVTVAFAAPTNNGGSPITSYTATCGTNSNSGPTSPIVVNALAGGVVVSCAVTATNGDGTSLASAGSNSVTPLLLTAVQSRKTHGSAGPFDLPIDRTQTIGGSVTVEPRAIGGGHKIVFQFDGSITSAGTTTISPSMLANTTFTSNEIVVTLSNASDNQRVAITLTNINGSVSPPTVAIGFLLGDVNNSRSVNASDISGVKARSGAVVTSTNAVYDVNASGGINAADISAVKARAATVLITGASTITSPATATIGYIGEPYSFNLTSDSALATIWSVISGSLPSGLLLNSLTGQISGTPTAATTSTFTVQANNTIAPIPTQVVSLQIIPARAPQITSATPAVAAVGVPYSHTFTAVGGQPIVWSEPGVLPGWLTLTSGGILSGTPPAQSSITFTITATNAVGSVSQSVNITANPPVPISMTSASPAGATVDTLYCHAFAASAPIPSGGWQISAGAVPEWVTLNAKRGVICGIPRSADVGTSNFTITANNGGSTASQAVALTVGTVYVPPPVITSPTPANATVDLTYCHPFTASQTIVSGGWTVIAGVKPEWATLNAKRGVICGIPRTIDIGSSTFTIPANTGTATATQSVTLTVGAVPLILPTITSVAPTAALVGATVTITGTGLSSVTSVKIGTAEATPFIPNGAGTSISATVPTTAVVGVGSVVLGTSANQTAATASFVVLSASTGEVSVDGIPLPAISKFPTVTPTHAGLSGAGSYVNAYAMDPTRCNTSPTLRRSWQHNIDLADYRQRQASDLFAMQGDEALTYKITIPTIDAAGGITYQDNVGSGGNLATVFMSISATPCDFDVTKLPYVPSSPTKQCYQAHGAGGNIQWANFPVQASNAYVYCNLVKGATYYVNVRFVDGINQQATTCANGLFCGGGFTFN